MDAVSDGMARGIAAGDVESCRGDIRGNDISVWQFVRESNGEAAGTGAYVRYV